MRSKSGNIMLSDHDIISVSHRGKDCIFSITGSKEGRLRMSLEKFYMTLDKHRFLKIDMCFVINLAYVSHVEHGLLMMTDGRTYPVPRGKIRACRHRIEEYKREKSEMSISRT